MTNEWIKNELEQMPKQEEYDKRDSMIFEENKIKVIEVDFGKPFESWEGEQSGKQIKKKIVPVVNDGKEKNWWLNVKNPAYKELLDRAVKGETVFKIMQTGKQQNTKYVFVD